MYIFNLDFFGYFLFIAGLVVGLGAVTVIDIHGFLGRKSPYWTEATTRTHKVTKPMIWVGMFLAIVGGFLLYRNQPFVGVPAMHALLAVCLIANGFFLSFSVSPYLLKKEKEGKSQDLLPVSWQKKITVSLIFSDLCWWLSVGLFVVFILSKM